MKLNCGTNEVERYAQVVCKQNVRRGRNDKLIKDTMKHKVEDAKFDENEVRKLFVRSKIEYCRVIQRGSMIDMVFNRMMKYEVEQVWNEGKLRNTRKVSTLLQKWRPKQNMKTIRNVMYGNDDLEGMSEAYEADEDPVMYGNLELSENVKVALKLQPNFMMYEKVDATKIEVEIEKGICKARYALMNEPEKNDEDVNNPENQNDTEHVEVFDSVGKVANYSNLRVTELPTCQRLYPPKPTTITKELHLQNLREKLMRKVEEYKEKRCNNHGFCKKTKLAGQRLMV